MSTKLTECHVHRKGVRCVGSVVRVSRRGDFFFWAGKEWSSFPRLVGGGRKEDLGKPPISCGNPVSFWWKPRCVLVFNWQPERVLDAGGESHQKYSQRQSAVSGGILAVGFVRSMERIDKPKPPISCGNPRGAFLCFCELVRAGTREECQGVSQQYA